MFKPPVQFKVVSLEKGTVFSIEVRRAEFSRLRFLATRKGFREELSYTDALPYYEDHITYTAIYDVHFGFWEERGIKKTIKKNGGHVTNVLHLGEEPIFSKEDRTMLIDCFIMAGAAFFSGLGGVHLVSPGKVLEAFEVAGITAAATFCTELIIERRRRRY